MPGMQAAIGEPMVLREHNDAVTDIAWSPDDLRLLTCGADSFICIWCTRVCAAIGPGCFRVVVVIAC
jgi:WD40 repeat protein